VLDEVMADLASRRPAVIFVTAEAPLPPELAALISEEYRPAGRVEYAELYERVGG
jgi:hypothetical protein